MYLCLDMKPNLLFTFAVIAFAVISCQTYTSGIEEPFDFGDPITLDSLEISVGERIDLLELLLQKGLPKRNYTFNSTNTSSSIVSQKGIVEGIAVGQSSITASVDKGFIAGYVVEVAERMKSVDLGLSVCWATCNLGASKSVEGGGLYQWAAILDNPDYAELNGKWRIPTVDEWKELMDNCTWRWTDNYNRIKVKGCIVTSKMEGFTDKSIFLPESSIKPQPESYWSSSLIPDRPSEAFALEFTRSHKLISSEDCLKSLSVRLVSD